MDADRVVCPDPDHPRRHGLLKPLTRFRFGAFVVGSIVGSVAYGTAMLALPATLPAPWWLPLIPGLLVGGGLGVVRYDE